MDYTIFSIGVDQTSVPSPKNHVQGLDYFSKKTAKSPGNSDLQGLIKKIKQEIHDKSLNDFSVVSRKSPNEKPDFSTNEWFSFSSHILHHSRDMLRITLIRLFRLLRGFLGHDRDKLKKIPRHSKWRGTRFTSGLYFAGRTMTCPA